MRDVVACLGAVPGSRYGCVSPKRRRPRETRPRAEHREVDERARTWEQRFEWPMVSPPSW